MEPGDDGAVDEAEEGAEGNDDEQSADGDKGCVAKRLPVFHLFDDVGEVIKGKKLAVNNQREFNDVFSGFESAQNQIVDGQEHDDGGKDKENFSENAVSSLLFHQKLHSLLHW